MCGESWTSPARMPQFIEARAVDTMQDCDSTICGSDCLYFPVLTWILRFSTQLNAPSCSLETEHPPTPHHHHHHHIASLFLPLCIARSPVFQKLQPCVWGDPMFKRTPWETTLLSSIDFKLQMYDERGQSFRKREGGRRDGEIKKRETDEVKRGDVCIYVCVHLPPCRLLNPREDWLPSKDNLSQTLWSISPPPFSPPPPIHFIFLSSLSPFSHPCLPSMPFALPIAVTSPSCLSTLKPPALPSEPFQPPLYDLFSSFWHTPLQKKRTKFENHCPGPTFYSKSWGGAKDLCDSLRLN